MLVCHELPIKRECFSAKVVDICTLDLHYGSLIWIIEPNLEFASNLKV